MLFTTPEFILLYLPVVIFGFYFIGKKSHAGAAAWLLLVSLGFYTYWKPQFTLLLLGSIAWSYWVGQKISLCLAAQSTSDYRQKAQRWLVCGITINLALLAYFKYANFFADNIGLLTGSHWHIDHITLPIGISFFTFTQIAFLADAYQKGIQEFRKVHYGLFVTYFPHLIAGPVLHHAQMMPQFSAVSTYRLNPANFAAGLAIFTIGITKKVIFADGISPYADAAFNGAANGFSPDLIEAWLAALSYTFQLYFDFSGYSDMAIGLSWMFNIQLPYNFNSPYKACSVTDFWRRWHMTLSAFLKDYLYIPLGGNRLGKFRRHFNLFITMLLGGLWHGANWTFVIWGALHGFYLIINHAYRAVLGKRHDALQRYRSYRVITWLLTMLAIILAWIFFRADNFHTAFVMLRSLISAYPADAIHPLYWNEGLKVSTGWLWCLICTVLVIAFPNSNRIGEHLRAACATHQRARTVLMGAMLTLILLVMLLNATRSAVSAFIYFNF